MAYDDPFAYGDVTPPDDYSDPYAYGDVTPPEQTYPEGNNPDEWGAAVEAGFGLAGDLIQSNPQLLAYGPSRGTEWGGSSSSTNMGGLAQAGPSMRAGEERNGGSWIDKFLGGIRDNPEAAKIIAGMFGGLYTASVEKKRNAIANRQIGVQEDRLSFDKDRANRTATSMQGVTVPGVGLIGSQIKQPKFNPDIYPQFTARGQK